MNPEDTQKPLDLLASQVLELLRKGEAASHLRGLSDRFAKENRLRSAIAADIAAAVQRGEQRTRIYLRPDELAKAEMIAAENGLLLARETAHGAGKDTADQPSWYRLSWASGL